MKLITNNKTYALSAFSPGHDGCAMAATKPIEIGDTLTVTDDEGVLLREYTVAEYLRCEADGCTVRLTNTPEVVPTPPDLSMLKADKIAESKTALATYLATHPLTWTDGKRYSVTEEKQTLLGNALAVYRLALAAGTATELTWNATGETCAVWSFDALCALALGIAAYVRPLVAHQQALEVEIRAAQTAAAVEAITIAYA